MSVDIPEGGWPPVEVQAPYEFPSLPTFETALLSASDEQAVDELLTFYHNTLIPQLACAPDGSLSPHPQKAWLMSGDAARVPVVSRVDGELVGAWIIKNNGIYYPCATVEFIAPIFRSLWDETIKHFDYVWGDTRNPVIMAFAKKAVRIPRSPNSPTVTDEKLEWRKGNAAANS